MVAGSERHTLSAAREGAAGPEMSPPPAPALHPPLPPEHELHQPTDGRARSISPTHLCRGTRFPADGSGASARLGAKSAASAHGVLSVRNDCQHMHRGLPRARAQVSAHVPKQAAIPWPGLPACPRTGCTMHKHQYRSDCGWGRNQSIIPSRAAALQHRTILLLLLLSCLPPGCGDQKEGRQL